MASKYMWTITKDHINTEAEGTSGPRDATHPSEARGQGSEDFRMYDDDDILYYEGTIWGDYEGFEPLDDFGTPNAGCTGIMYRTKGKGWEYL